MKIRPNQLKKAAELAKVPSYDDLDYCSITEAEVAKDAIVLELVTYNQHDGKYRQKWLIDYEGNSVILSKSY